MYNRVVRSGNTNPLFSKLQAYLETRPEIQAGYVFGSRVTGRARRDSDIDVAVLLEDKAARGDLFRYKIDRMSELMKILGTDRIDLVILNEAPPLLAHRALSRGLLIFERSASARVQFQVRAVNRYLDTQPMRDLYLSYLKEHAKEGRIFGR